MTYYPDLSRYEYHRGMFDRPRTLNVGWLAREHSFDVAPPRDELLDAIWRYCKVSVAQMRGIHNCELCPGEYVESAEYKGEKLLLATSEFRVFDDNGDIYAAPTLIFHYVQRHHYRPPQAFVAALLRGPAPPEPAYFARLQQLGLEWDATSEPQGPRMGIRRPVEPKK